MLIRRAGDKTKSLFNVSSDPYQHVLLPLMSPCESDFTYYDSPEFLSLSLHLLTTLSTPIYSLGMYCILFKTPKAMNSVKWSLFALHFWIVLMDYTFALLTVPYILIPELAAVTYGVLNYLEVPTLFQVTLEILNVANMSVAMSAVYENRFFILCDFRFKRFWSWIRKAWLSMHYFSVFVITLRIIFLVPEQESARLNVFQNLPCLPDYIYNANVFVLASDVTYHVICCCSFSTQLLLETGFYVQKLILNGRKQQKSKTISQKTYQMHQQFLIALLIQMTIPFIMLAVPFAYSFFLIFSNHYNQFTIHMVVIFFASHGLLSTVVMILVHRPYRLAVMELFGRSVTIAPNLRKSTVVSIH